MDPPLRQKIHIVPLFLILNNKHASYMEEMKNLDQLMSGASTASNGWSPWFMRSCGAMPIADAGTSFKTQE